MKKNYKIGDEYWNYEIGQSIIDDEKDIIIIDRKRINKRQYYKIKCNKCGFNSGNHIKSMNNHERFITEEYLIDVSAIKGLKKCPCCSNNIVVIGINDLATTNPEVIGFFTGGIKQAQKYHKLSQEYVDLICPICKTEYKYITVKNFMQRKYKCPICARTGSYPNRFMTNILKQLNIEFITEFSPPWINHKRYDFYIPSLHKIIEMDGGIGHGNNKCTKFCNSEESLMIDKYKDEKALLHGINVIRINSEPSTFKNIKFNIQNSLLKNIFNLNSIDWDKANLDAEKSNIILCCNLYNHGITNPIDIKKITNIPKTTVLLYLHKGTESGICNYDRMINHKSIYNRGCFKKEKVICITTNMIFESIADAIKYYNLNKSTNISLCCKGERNYAGKLSDGTHLKWMYYQNYIKLNKKN